MIVMRGFFIEGFYTLFSKSYINEVKLIILYNSTVSTV